MDSVHAAPGAVILREAGLADGGPMHWLARRRNRFIVTSDKVVLVQRGSFREWVSEIPLASIRHIEYRRALSASRFLFGSTILLTSFLLGLSQALAVVMYGAAWFSRDPLSPLFALACTVIAAAEGVLIVLHSRVGEVRITAGAKRHDLLCSGVEAADIDTVWRLQREKTAGPSGT